MTKAAAIIIIGAIALLVGIMLAVYACIIVGAHADRQSEQIYRRHSGGYQPKGGKDKPLPPPKGKSGKSDCGIDGGVE